MTISQAKTLSQEAPLRPMLLIGTVMLFALATSVAAQDRQKDVTFTNADGTEIGIATLTGTPSGLLIELDLQNLPAETWHGFHIHENGACNAEGGFDAAGGHFSITDTSHGYLAEGGHHAGDMPNQYVSADGTLKAQVFNSQAVLGGDADNVTGRALMLHGGADDYESQPSGDAGDRIACAVIE